MIRGKIQTSVRYLMTVPDLAYYLTRVDGRRRMCAVVVVVGDWWLLVGQQMGVGQKDIDPSGDMDDCWRSHRFDCSVRSRKSKLGRVSISGFRPMAGCNSNVHRDAGRQCHPSC